MNENPLSLASDIVDKARRLGADEVDAYVVSSTESSVQVRRGATERVVEAGDNAVGIRVIKAKRTAICSTSDMTPRALDQLVRDAVELASISEPDEYAGLPERDDLAFNVNSSLQMYDEAIESLTTDEMRELALRMEAAMFDHDKRVTNSDGAEMSVTRAQVALANSLGFGGSYVGTAAALSIEAICDDAEGKKRNDYWYTAERALHRLESPEDVGRKAAQRAVAKLGARKVGTTAVPVVWEATVAHALLRIIAEAVSGEALYRRSTFLAELEGQQVGSGLLSIIDDPLLAGRLGSRPFDGEGVTSRALPIFEAGVFRNFLFDTYNARRVGRRSTGAAQRGIASAPAPGSSNFVMAEGETAPEALYAGIDSGLMLTDLMGFGVNLTTGDFSRGAQGFWIENGRVTYPVTEINLSGNLKDMLAGIDAVGNDLLWRGSSAAPSFRMSRLTVSGL
ncbi:MAG TPA: TldD/PmbA family protein [Dehalococcoidia bacterium]|nr:TldD/PmbA family protein [Dehalococcoidia bacterium]